MTLAKWQLISILKGPATLKQTGIHGHGSRIPATDNDPVSPEGYHGLIDLGMTYFLTSILIGDLVFAGSRAAETETTCCCPRARL